MSRTLIIEDNAKVSSVLAEFLRRKGHAADVSGDGESGLRAAGEKAYDLLLVDLRLPGMNGEEVCRKIRASERGAATPIVVMSGFVRDPQQIERMKRELTLQAFITKPFTSDALFQLIGPYLDTSSARGAANRPARDVTGNLSRTPFAKVLLSIFQKRLSGLLTVTRERTRRTFSIVGGAPVDLDLLSPADDFGNHLAHKNMITSAELKVYEEARTKTGFDALHLFIRMGCISPERFQEEYRNFLHDRLIDCFSWKSGTFLFAPKTSFLSADPSAAVFLPALFYRGFQAHLPTSAIAAFLEEKGNLYPSKTEAFFSWQNHLADELRGTQLFDMIDGVSTCSGIVSTTDLDDAALVLYTLDFLQLLAYDRNPKRSLVSPSFPVRQRVQRQVEQPEEVESFEDLGEELSGLAEGIAGLAEAKQTTAEGSGEARTSLETNLRERWQDIKDKNYYEIFGMSQNTFSFEKLKSAYFDLTRDYGPEQFFASSGEVMELAEEFLSLVSNAYHTLSNVVSKENYDALLVSQAPTGTDEKKFFEQVQFQSGKVMLDQGQYESAEKTFTTCLTMSPDKPEYQVYLAVAIYHNPSNRENPAAVKRAKDLVNRSLQWEKTAIAYALKGTMLLDEGLTNLAEAEFNKALRLNPKNRTALKKRDEIRLRKEEAEKRGGFFQKMFK